MSQKTVPHTPITNNTPVKGTPANEKDAMPKDHPQHPPGAPAPKAENK